MTDNTDTVSKDTLRHEARRFRDRIDPSADNFESASDLFFAHIVPKVGQSVALYWPKGREFDPRIITERLLKEGIVCALPVMQDKARDLKFAVWDEGVSLVPGPYDILQPIVDDKTKWVDPDIVIVPLLAFDRRGYRLGYGGGYYDVTLRALRAKKSIIAVGVGYAEQAVLFALPVEAHDERLDWVITQQKAHRFV